MELGFSGEAARAGFVRAQKPDSRRITSDGHQRPPARGLDRAQGGALCGLKFWPRPMLRPGRGEAPRASRPWAGLLAGPLAQ